jgi:hypothetical protein
MKNKYTLDLTGNATNASNIIHYFDSAKYGERPDSQPHADKKPINQRHTFLEASYKPWSVTSAPEYDLHSKTHRARAAGPARYSTAPTA